jgi:hypothetical protein
VLPKKGFGGVIFNALSKTMPLNKEAGLNYYFFVESKLKNCRFMDGH